MVDLAVEDNLQAKETKVVIHLKKEKMVAQDQDLAEVEQLGLEHLQVLDEQVVQATQ